MPIQKQEFYEGAALHLLARTERIVGILVDSPFFILNGRLLVLLKYSTKGRSPWGFTFTVNEQKWRRRVAIFGSPDFVFPNVRVAVFVDGCFWHGCPFHGSIPNTNRTFWRRKLDRNKERDRLVRLELKKLGWRIIRIWQHELRDSKKVARRIDRVLMGRL